ncbi:MAG: M1 family metallopeptidase [Caulobacter sp.]|nr:M1 family metallopeptidase [Caulobacter sp.]
MTPLRYRLRLAPHLAAGTFAGDLSVDLAVDASDATLTLDALDLDIEAAWIDGAPADWRQDGEKLVVTAPAPLGDTVVLRLTYAGQLSDTPRGLYRGDGFVASQLQPDHAHRLFPCVDDLAFRAVLELSVTVPDGWIAISNAAVAGNRDGETIFAPSPPLPTHLMAVAMGAFRTTSAGGINLNTLTPGPNDAWVLDTAARALAFFGDWLGVPYPFGKLDLVLLPQVGAAGMENSGAIFLRQGSVSAPTREGATLIAHEIAHQWFGGLVTVAGWEDLWLNEGFATFLAPKALAAIAPDLVDEAAETRQVREALHADWAPTGRPLRQGGATSGEIAELFDVIAYRKGAGLLSTLQAWLGEEVFRRGLRLYLQNHALQAARSEDLWSALESASGQPVSAVAGPFADQPGAPAIRLHWKAQALTLTRVDSAVGPLPLQLKLGLADGQVVHADCLLDGTAEIALPAPLLWAFANAGAGRYVRSLPTAPRPPLAALTDAEATVLLEDAWLSLWIGETDLLACLGLIREAALTGRALGSARNHLREIGDLLAGGARQAAFLKWRADLPALAEAPPDSFDSLLAQLATTADREQLVTRLCAITDAAMRPHQLSLLADPALSDAEAQRACETLLAAPAAALDTWNWLKTHWDQVGHRLVGWGGRGAIAGLAAFSDPAIARDIAAFFAGRPLPGAERTLEASLARIAGRAHFRQQWQTAMDCLLMRTAHAGAGPPPRQPSDQRLLALLAAGFDGALLQRRIVDQQGLPAPPWMHSAANLQAALAATERQSIQAWGGAAANAGDLAQRLIEDLNAAADQLDRLIRKLADGDAGTYHQAAAALARARATQDRRLREAILLASLSGDEPAADILRAEALADPPADPDFDPFARTPNRRQRLALKALLRDTPTALRALAADIAAALAR